LETISEKATAAACALGSVTAPPPTLPHPAATDLPFLVLPVRIRKHEELELNNSADETQTFFLFCWNFENLALRILVGHTRL
jgi:hypothetical protein